MARAHVKRGYSYSDVVDFRIARRRNPSPLSGIIAYLNTAADYRLQVVTVDATGRRKKDGVLTDSTPASCKYWAVHYLNQARAWRLERLA
jgi:hypothetical protein